MFWPDYSSFYERKTAHSDGVFSLKAQEKVQGIFALVCHVPKTV